MADPQERDRQIALGERFFRRGNLDGAAACFRLAVLADPDSAPARAQLGWCLRGPSSADEAVEHLRIAASLDPSSERVLESLGMRLVRAGQFSEAGDLFRRVLAMNPQSANALCGLVGCGKISPDDRPLVDLMAESAEDPGRTDSQRSHLHRAAGKAFDDLGEYGTAMRHFDESNRIAEKIMRESGQTFGAEELRSYTDLLIETFTADRFHLPFSVGSDSERPVLIVGMIRSGTTLLDQTLSRHPRIGSAGEINFWTGVAPGEMMRMLLQGKVDLAKAEEICAEYRVLLQGYAPAKARIIDKMPMNFLGLGLIHLLFRNARIIHTRRNPRDTCLSIYVTELGTPRAPFAVSRANIIFMFRQYARLMAHWRSVLPANRFLEVDYESVVADQESEVRRVLEFLGLEWDGACLDGGRSAGIITTPSAWQARQPIYGTSVGRWRRYEPWLGEFAELAEEASPQFWDV